MHSTHILERLVETALAYLYINDASNGQKPELSIKTAIEHAMKDIVKRHQFAEFTDELILLAYNTIAEKRKG